MDTHDARAAMVSNAASGTISFSSEVYGVLKSDPVGGRGHRWFGSAPVGMNHIVGMRRSGSSGSGGKPTSAGVTTEKAKRTLRR
jgi:hypothetical protein